MKLMECYTTLNLSPNSEWYEVKRSYHFLARKYHPDVHSGKPGFPSKFQKITQAFKTLEKSHKAKNGENKKNNKTRTTQREEPVAEQPDKPVTVTPYDNSPTQLRAYRENESRKKEGSGKGLKNFSNTLFDWERNLFLLDTRKNIQIRKRHPDQANIVRVRKGNDAFQVRIPPGPWTRMFIRIPNKGNKSLFSQKRGDLILNIQVPGNETLTPPNPTFFYKIRIPSKSLGENKVWTLKSANGPIRFTLPKNVGDGQKFVLKSNPSKDGTTSASHIITLNLV